MSVFKNSRTHFGCMPISKNINCIVVGTSKIEPFLQPFHLLSDEIYHSEVDVMIRNKTTGRLVGRLGRVTEFKTTVGQAWYKVDTTEAEPEVIKYILERVSETIPFASKSPYFVSEHVNFLQPVVSMFINQELQQNGIELTTVAWLDLEV